MSSTLYSIYKKQNFTLAKTLVIKLSDIAEQINRELEKTGFYVIDPDFANYNMLDNRLYWKYYQNLAGEYHHSDKDKLMRMYGHPYMQVTIPNEDGRPIIVDFTYNFLHGEDADSSIGNEYRFGSSYYNELVYRYPEFESLILGILSPIDIEVAIAAKDGEIIQIDDKIKAYRPDRSETYFKKLANSFIVGSSLIEPQEYNLVDKLQSFIYNFLSRWHNRDYGAIDDLYVSSMVGILYLQLPSQIHNIRLANCKTQFAHSFHIYEFFASHGKLDAAVRKLSLPVALYLYRNFIYLEANSGKELVLKALVDNAFTPEEVPLSGWIARHDISYLPDQLLPKPEFLRDPLTVESMGRTSDEKDVTQMVTKEIPLARLNGRDLDIVIPKITETIAWSGDDRLSTKMLESELIDVPPPYNITLIDFLMWHWVYHASVNNTKVEYHGTVFVNHPISLDRLAFSPVNAYRLVMYCLNKALAGIVLERPLAPELTLVNYIPKRDYYLPTASHRVKPSLADFVMKVDVKKVTNKQLNQMFFSAVPVDVFHSEIQFNDTIKVYYDEYMRQCQVLYKTLDRDGRGYLESCQHDTYWHNIACDFSFDNPRTTYDDWFNLVGVDLSDCTDDDLLTLSMDLIVAATGIDYTSRNNLLDKQKALITVLKHFTSYTVQILDSIGATETIQAGFNALRWTNIRQKTNPVSSPGLEYNLDFNAGYHGRMNLINDTFTKTVMFTGFTPIGIHAILQPSDYQISRALVSESYRFEVQSFGVSGVSIRINEERQPTLYKAPSDTQAFDYDLLSSHNYPTGFELEETINMGAKISRISFHDKTSSMDTSDTAMVMSTVSAVKLRDTTIYPTAVDTAIFTPSMSGVALKDLVYSISPNSQVGGQSNVSLVVFNNNYHAYANELIDVGVGIYSVVIDDVKTQSFSESVNLDILISSIIINDI